MTTTSLLMESTRLRAVAVSTSVTNDNQCDDSLGVSSGTIRMGSGRPKWFRATSCIISAYVSTSGPPTSKVRPRASVGSSTPTR